eukprot:CAMPEP_0113639318 /NCGR_PEP_ID=MMETSP0017_2-20120614/20625_1 /TAXON_ID=2856 /ORGANISM="Cylindrotheca closterium" /LENGTH=187 /DNA_ID=CAMNT_0000550523 /DNA_START=468 /DNA_END=1031 /DNA_ORIENTATION=+ /assembly_acc=CAM_ASM_000147
MALTEEQKERIKQNRERALRIKKERMERLAKEKEDADKKRKLNQGGGGGGREGETLQAATIGNEGVVSTNNKKQKLLEAGKKQQQQQEEKDDLELEEFEVGASEWITKSEAMKIYCVPQGTLAVCQVEERPNPHHASWKPMKLYLRSQVRQKGRKRFGGLEGLVEERNKRRQKQLEKDMAKARSIFE